MIRSKVLALNSLYQVDINRRGEENWFYIDQNGKNSDTRTNGPCDIFIVADIHMFLSYYHRQYGPSILRSDSFGTVEEYNYSLSVYADMSGEPLPDINLSDKELKRHSDKIQKEVIERDKQRNYTYEAKI